MNNRSDEPRKLVLTLPELAKVLRCSKNHVYACAARNELPEPLKLIRIGRRLLVSAASVDRLLETQGAEHE